MHRLGDPGPLPPQCVYRVPDDDSVCRASPAAAPAALAGHNIDWSPVPGQVSPVELGLGPEVGGYDGDVDCGHLVCSLITAGAGGVRIEPAGSRALHSAGSFNPVSGEKEKFTRSLIENFISSFSTVNCTRNEVQLVKSKGMNNLRENFPRFVGNSSVVMPSNVLLEPLLLVGVGPHLHQAGLFPSIEHLHWVGQIEEIHLQHEITN